jgi:hypothetical protein
MGGAELFSIGHFTLVTFRIGANARKQLKIMEKLGLLDLDAFGGCQRQGRALGRSVSIAVPSQAVPAPDKLTLGQS